MTAVLDSPRHSPTIGSTMFDPEWLTPSEAALLVGTSSEAVADLIADGRLHASGTRRAGMALVPAAELLGAVDGGSLVERMGNAPRVSPAPEVWPVASVELISDGARAALERVDARARGPEATNDGPRPVSKHRSRPRRAGGVVLLLVCAGLVAKSLFLQPHPQPARSPLAAHQAAPATEAPATSEPDTNVMPESPLPPGFATPVFVQQGRWVTAATTVTNPNTRWWLPEIRLGFVVYDRHGRKLARRSTTISVPPGGSVRATAPAISTRPRAASAASVVLDPEPARWVDLEDFAPPGLRLDGAAVSKSREGKVAVVAMLSNRTAALGAGKLVCVTTDAAGGLTGAIAVVISFPAHQQGPVSIPVPRPAGGSLAADCEIGPAGR